ncbi:Dihydroorotate dehydrogenase (quinone) [Aliiroseovarius sp. xm-m-379]|uniref:quinone-dependent dihydroorotate dehydrogenase n=1 Tax=unclassified Aliiroseovarius TaxID=2623558 RepID=UPI0015691E76|nr:MULTISPECIES: quinone-dependent dihydroorotate dehydrogenase [unclassified Aliiroseovarius]NRP11373.1 Dihydroorotate dehydrogenase (quinone) [Aliiroseovarius sp. xm-d-517]NRP23866.1 Dihydroorotate dehydrogenase (quinone) [Aliiroseovarius sp. xm-m-379]NRP28887.1 Dihydroorotate dehydrogenase (quinone) [Aliiroseovarius sp. xm-m-314]NRP32665.1 Dihydroorotate dehydrogenase (quinone) [Aliiroseovarius sp. xm-a-104]NRP42221.1 Dihydroorotate dehydrogenase (quinone) [Aliiroseovarius sp. xm-m-339-2]
MNLVEKLALKALHQTDPERAHTLSLMALRSGVVPLAGDVTSDRLKTSFCGMDLLNPVGLAAGYDKNAQAVSQLTQAGFGFVEVGAITPRAQPGNPKPRLFRLTEDRAVINRFGFNNEGMDAAAARLARRDRRRPVPVGLNLGANKDSEDRAADFAKVLECCGPHLDFATVNVSSPNTEKLRDLQGADALRGLLSGVQEVRGGLDKYIPVFLKIAPDLSDAELAEIVEVALEVKIDAVIATNTTLSRDGLKSAHKGEMGGLSGAPLFEKSTRVLARLSKLSDGKLPLIGVGGISSAEQAYAKIRVGASVVQLYSALAYQGLSLVEEVARGLDTLLARDGFTKVSEAVGTGREDWL